MSDTFDARPESTPAAQSSRGATGLPTNGCLLGIDFGTKRIGFAVCDDRQVIASPLQTYTRTIEPVDRKHLQQICVDYRINGLVVGLALHMSGDESRISAQAREYGTWASSVTGLPHAYWDERFTSAAADVKLLAAGVSDTRRDSRRDKLAAQAILQSYIDAPNRSAMPVDRRESRGIQ